MLDTNSESDALVVDSKKNKLPRVARILTFSSTGRGYKLHVGLQAMMNCDAIPGQVMYSNEPHVAPVESTTAICTVEKVAILGGFLGPQLIACINN